MCSLHLVKKKEEGEKNLNEEKMGLMHMGVALTKRARCQ